MKRRLLGFGLLLAVFLVLPVAELLAQKKKGKGGPAPGTAVDSSKLHTGDFVGILKTTPGSDRAFTIEVEQVKLVPSGNGGRGGRGGRGNNNGAQRIMQAQRRLQQAQMQAARARTPQMMRQAQSRMQQAMRQVNQAMAQLQRGNGRAGGIPPGYKISKSKVMVEFQASEKVKVRTMMLPEAFDDKGEIKKYSAKEKAELRGKDSRLPGYESAVEKLEVGQVVKIHLALSHKKAPAKKKGDDDADTDTTADKAKQASLIVILKEAGPGTAPQPRRGKKKK